MDMNMSNIKILDYVKTKEDVAKVAMAFYNLQGVYKPEIDVLNANPTAPKDPQYLFGPDLFSAAYTNNNPPTLEKLREDVKTAPAITGIVALDKADKQRVGLSTMIQMPLMEDAPIQAFVNFYTISDIIIQHKILLDLKAEFDRLS